MLRSILSNSYRQKRDYFIVRYSFSDKQAKLLTILSEVFACLFAIFFYVAVINYSNLLFLATLIISKVILLMPRGNNEIKKAYFINQIFENKIILVSLPLFAMNYFILIISTLFFISAYFINLKFVFNNKKNEIFKGIENLDLIFCTVVLLTLYFSSENEIWYAVYYFLLILASSFFKLQVKKIILFFLLGYTCIVIINHLSFFPSIIFYLEALIFIVVSTKIAISLEVENQLNLRRSKINLTDDIKNKVRIINKLNYINILVYVLCCLPLVIHFTNYISTEFFDKAILSILYSCVFFLAYISTCLFAGNKFFSGKGMIRNKEDYVRYRFSSLFSIASLVVIQPVLLKKMLPNEGMNYLSFNEDKGIYLIVLNLCVCLLLVLYIKKVKADNNLIIGDNK